ncbi:MAG TPA: hypothetical protein VMU32_03800 [Solirubrobacteraceae bacterium]|nr:hypothetical protein [Solirubrobacteraceae bacterium]
MTLRQAGIPIISSTLIKAIPPRGAFWAHNGRGMRAAALNPATAGPEELLAGARYL